MKSIVDLADEALIIIEESKKDDDVDANKDGKKDVDEISGADLLKRKTLLVLKKMNPEKIDKAIGSIYKVYVFFYLRLPLLAIDSTAHSTSDFFGLTYIRILHADGSLWLRFFPSNLHARSPWHSRSPSSSKSRVSSGDWRLHCVSTVDEPNQLRSHPLLYCSTGDRFITPVLKKITPDEYARWAPVVMSWIAKAIAMSIAWQVQTVISAFTSALKGGLMMALATYQFCIYRKINPFGLIPPDHSKSVVDEGLSYVFAALGFYTQFRSGFSLPTPFNLLLWPFQAAEVWIRWTITNKA